MTLVTASTAMTNANPHRVCRSIDVEIPNQTRWGQPLGGLVKPEALPLGYRSVSDFLTVAVGTAIPDPNKPAWQPPKKQCPKIEFLSHRETVDFGSPMTANSLFFQAVHECFANHYPLALSPEGLLYLVLHEVSVTVKRDPEFYRDLFTTSNAKQIIKVRNDSLRMGDPNSPWADVMDGFNLKLAEKVPSAIMAEALPEFSTHTVASQAASLVAFMDAASPYYEYRVMTKCGIPKIRLLGVPDDYKKLVRACTALAARFERDLEQYFHYLLPVVDKIASQAAGEPLDNAFWASIYKHLSASGTDAMTGWITAFLNYENEEGQVRVKQDKHYDWNRDLTKGWPSGYERSGTPTHLNCVPFVWEYLGKEYPMQFIGGILAVGNVDGYALPQLGYGILHKEG